MNNYNSDEIKTKIGLRIKEIRKSKGMTLEELSSKCGIVKQQLSDYEHGRKEPMVCRLYKIAGGLDINISLLFSDEPLDNNDSKGKVCMIADECSFYQPPQRGNNGGKE